VDQVAREDAEARRGDAERVVGHDHHERPRARSQRSGKGGGEERSPDRRPVILAGDAGKRGRLGGLKGERLGLGHVFLAIVETKLSRLDRPQARPA
jgi:hypothetical protein